METKFMNIDSQMSLIMEKLSNSMEQNDYKGQTGGVQAPLPPEPSLTPSDEVSDGSQ